MTTDLEADIARLRHALGVYDGLKKDHAALTTELKEAKESVDVAARAVVAAHDGADDAQTGLFDPPEPGEASTIEVDGRTGRVIKPKVAEGNGTAWEMTPSDEDPSLCICGWEIASVITGHAVRHQRMVDALGAGTT